MTAMPAVQEISPAAADVITPVAALQPTRRIAALDGIRGIAVLMVIWGHADYLPNGAVGVDVFFVLSGYLITALLLDERTKRGRISFPNFYMRRMLRLLPALLLLLALYVPTFVILGQRLDRTLGDAAIALCYASNWTKAFGHRPDFIGHTWSLSIEEQFYILWPMTVLGLYWLVRRGRAGAAICLAAALAILCYRHWMLSRGASLERVYFGLDTRGDDLLAGAALAFWTPLLPRLVALVIGWLGLAALFAFVFCGTVYPGFFMGQHPYAYVWVMTLAILLGLLNDRQGWMARLLSFKPLVWVGMISYGLYLFHVPILVELVHHLKWERWHAAAVGIPLSFGIAALSFYSVERPCLRLKDRFRPAQTGARE